MTCPRLHWTTDNPSGMHRCQFQHLCVLIFNCALALVIYIFVGLILMLWHRETHITHKGTDKWSWARRGSNSRPPDWGHSASHTPFHRVKRMLLSCRDPIHRLATNIWLCYKESNSMPMYQDISTRNDHQVLASFFYLWRCSWRVLISGSIHSLVRHAHFYTFLGFSCGPFLLQLGVLHVIDVVAQILRRSSALQAGCRKFHHDDVVIIMFCMAITDQLDIMLSPSFPWQYISPTVRRQSLIFHFTMYSGIIITNRTHNDAIKWKHFPRYWPFVRRIHRSPVNSSHKVQWRGALMFSLICAWMNGWVNNRDAGGLRRHDFTLIMTSLQCSRWCFIERLPVCLAISRTMVLLRTRGPLGWHPHQTRDTQLHSCQETHEHAR